MRLRVFSLELFLFVVWLILVLCSYVMAYTYPLRGDFLAGVHILLHLFLYILLLLRWKKSTVNKFLLLFLLMMFFLDLYAVWIFKYAD